MTALGSETLPWPNNPVPIKCSAGLFVTLLNKVPKQEGFANVLPGASANTCGHCDFPLAPRQVLAGRCQHPSFLCRSEEDSGGACGPVLFDTPDPGVLTQRWTHSNDNKPLAAARPWGRNPCVGDVGMTAPSHLPRFRPPGNTRFLKTYSRV